MTNQKENHIPTESNWVLKTFVKTFLGPFLLVALIKYTDYFNIQTGLIWIGLIALGSFYVLWLSFISRYKCSKCQSSFSRSFHLSNLSMNIRSCFLEECKICGVKLTSK